MGICAQALVIPVARFWPVVLLGGSLRGMSPAGTLLGPRASLLK